MELQCSSTVRNATAAGAGPHLTPGLALPLPSGGNDSRCCWQSRCLFFSLYHCEFLRLFIASLNKARQESRTRELVL
ncbi:hypothetical protein AAHA92_30077 [Salvia divinorum]|uniref:Uncharacterized protein n=1 Tax=Salvia divinorum TaxID=28513 RepID=A0ABD1G3F1_SALDI